MDHLGSNLLVIEDENKDPASTDDLTLNTILIPSDEPSSIGETIPVEILTQIFQSLRPSFDFLKEPHVYHHGYSTQHRHSLYKQYLLGVKKFINLRLVCRIWNDVIILVSHQDAVLPTRPLEKLEGASIFFTHGTEFIRSLILCDLLPNSKYSPTTPRSIAEQDIFTAQISQLANSDIRNLELYGKVIPAINRRGWLKRTLPRLQSTIQRLAMFEPTHIQISLTLVELGRSIVTLEIEGWDTAFASNNETPFHLPAQMPHLKSLSLHQCYLPSHSEKLVKLFSRIGSSRPHNAAAGTSVTRSKVMKSSLETLILVKVTTSQTAIPSASESPFIISLLRMNSIGRTLTSLTIQPTYFSEPPENFTKIIKECPSLVRLRYTSSVHQSLFAALPPTLRHLTLALQWTMTMNHYEHESCLKVPQDFICTLNSRYTLERLTVLLGRVPGGIFPSASSPFLPSGADFLEAACENAKVRLNWDHS